MGGAKYFCHLKHASKKDFGLLTPNKINLIQILLLDNKFEHLNFNCDRGLMIIKTKIMIRVKTC